jgi:hypothetical protein
LAFAPFAEDKGERLPMRDPVIHQVFQHARYCIMDRRVDPGSRLRLARGYSPAMTEERDERSAQAITSIRSEAACTGSTHLDLNQAGLSRSLRN